MHLIHIDVRLGTGLEELDAKLGGQGLPLAVGHHPLALVDIALVADQNLRDPPCNAKSSAANAAILWRSFRKAPGNLH